MSQEPRPAKIYYYRSEFGKDIARKIYEHDKRPYFEIPVGDSGEIWRKKSAKEIEIPPYNADKFKGANYIFICENEEQADTLSLDTFIGTCAPLGYWQKHLNKYFQAQNVLIVDDSAESKRTKQISRALQEVVRDLRFAPKSMDIDKILPQSTPLKKEEKKKATRDDYFELFEDVLHNPRKCMFSEKLMYYDGKIWNPAINELEFIKSEALLLNESRDAKYSTAHIQPHFFAYEKTKQPELLVDIPDWDGEDRISEMASLITLRESAGVDSTALSELLKEWCARVFTRLHDPMIQNRILVLQGGQGIGKDTWTSMLVDGLGQFCIPLAVMKDDKDTYLNLHRGLIMKISEFDKTAKTEVSTLKDIITAPSTNIRAPYDKDSKLRLSRCSFISSANINNLLRDTTGNRRFLIFEVEHIEYAYVGWDQEKIKAWQMQCLAEMVHLAKIGYTASNDSWRQMHDYIEEKTPEDYAVEITRQFIEEIAGDSLTSLGLGSQFLPSDKRIIEIVGTIARRHGFKYGAVKSMIQSRIGRFKRIGTKRAWVWELPSVNGLGEHISDPDDSQNI